MKNRIISIVIIIAMVAATVIGALSLTGCGNKEEPSAKVEVPEAPVLTPAEEEVVEQRPVKNMLSGIQMEGTTEYTDKEKEELAEAGNVEFVSRESTASLDLLYFIKNIEVITKKGKEYTKAEPDVDSVAQLFVPLYNDTIKNICYNIDANTSGDVMSIMAVITPSATPGDRALEYLFNAIAIQESGTKTVSYIEYADGVMNIYDTKNKKITMNTANNIVKRNSTPLAATDDQIAKITQVLYKKYGIMYEKARDAINDAELLEKEKIAVEEMEKVATAEQAEERQQYIFDQENKTPSIQMNTQARAANTKEFTDKNGNKASYTQEEWRYLLSIWDYTGDAEHYVVEHTNQELRNLLNQR